jgi:microcystin-dependent protein
MTKTIRAVVAASMLASLLPGAPAAAQEEPLLGEIRAFPYTFCPRGWLDTDGRLLEIRTNTALFSLLGITYGGDGRTTFALPYLKHEKLRYCIAVKGVFPSRNY